jgi:hypothetical protein
MRPTSCPSLSDTATIHFMRLRSRWVRSPLGKLSSLFLLLVGVVSTPGLGLTSFQRPHCARHELTVTPIGESDAGHAGHHGSAPSWNQPAHADCTHCPPSRCASLAPCAVTGTSPALPTLISLQSPSEHRVGAVRSRTSVHSTTLKPPTPPPQSIA